MEVPAAQTEVIGQKLGGHIQRLTNSIVRVHGRPIQVNVISAVDEENAKALHAALTKIKSHPFCERKGPLVIEYVGKDIDAALAIKTSYELGLFSKPASVRYRVVAELATVEKADYMACNALFNQFLAIEKGTDQHVVQQIRDLSKKFMFGRSLALRNPLRSPESWSSDDARIVYGVSGLFVRPADLSGGASQIVRNGGFPDWRR